MKNRRTAIMPYKPVYVSGNTLSIDVEDAKRLILFTGHKDKLAGHNEFQLDPRIQTNFGVGINDSAMPFDNEVGTVRLLNDVTDNVWLSRVNNVDKLKVLPSGFLQENSHLTVDKEAHVITEEFIIKNEATSNSATVIDSCDSVTGWSIYQGTGSISIDNGKLHVAGNAAAGGQFFINKQFPIDLSQCQFLGFSIRSTASKNIRLSVQTTELYASTNYIQWYNESRFVSGTAEQRFILPLKAPQNATGNNPTLIVGTPNLADVRNIIIGIYCSANEPIEFWIDDITADVGKPAYIEMQVPDHLADTSAQIYIHNGTTYQLYSACKLDPVFSVITGSSDNYRFLDGTKLNDVYGLYLGNSRFPIGTAGQTISGSLAGTQITYSQNAGTKQRIGLRIDLPPSDNGRTNFNKIRLKTVLYYTDIEGNVVPDKSGCGNNGLINGTATKLVNGLRFLGVPGCVDLGNKPQFNNLGEITIIAKIKQVNTAYANPILSKNYYNSYEFGVVTNKLKCYISNTAPLTGITAIGYDWRHVAFTYKYVDGVSNSQKLYVDGTLDAQGITSGSIGSTVSNVFIGQRSGENLYSSMDIEFLYIYGRELSNSELLAHYNNQYVDPSNLLGKYIFNSSNIGSTTFEFSQDTQLGTGINLMKKPYFCLYDPAKNVVNYYILTKKPLGGQFSYDENGNIYNVTFNLDPGTKVYKGKLKHVNLTQDKNNDTIPNFVDSTEIVSVEQLIGHLDFVYNYITKVDLTSSITANDFGLTLDNCPTVYATSSNNRVYANDVQLIPIGTAAAKDGVLNYFDVAGKSTIRIDEGQNCNAGECKLFDTVTSGNTDESTWKRVYRTDWVFTGDKVLENGIIRIIYSASLTQAASQYYYDGVNYTKLTATNPYAIPSGNLVINTLSVNRCVITTTNTFDSRLFTVTTTLDKGSYNFKFDILSPNYGFTIYPATRFMIRNNVVFDKNILAGTYDSPSLAISPAVSFFSETGVRIITYTSPRKEKVDAEYWTGGVTHVTAPFFTTSKPVWYGRLPFDCTLLYTDSGTMTGGDTI